MSRPGNLKCAHKRAITADTDLRLCRFFGLSNGYWLRAQVAYDTEVAEQTPGKVLDKIKPPDRGQPQDDRESRST